MAGTKRPSFLKRQKEQQRLARAVEKRETKAQRKQAKEDGTQLTEKFSGKPARGLANRFIAEMAAKNAPQLAFPAQNSVTGRLRQASAKAGRPDFVALWAGQAAPLSRALPAAELIAKLAAETAESIQNLKGILHDA